MVTFVIFLGFLKLKLIKVSKIWMMISTMMMMISRVMMIISRVIMISRVMMIISRVMMISRAGALLTCFSLTEERQRHVEMPG